MLAVKIAVPIAGGALLLIVLWLVYCYHSDLVPLFIGEGSSTKVGHTELINTANTASASYSSSSNNFNTNKGRETAEGNGRGGGGKREAMHVGGTSSYPQAGSTGLMAYTVVATSVPIAAEREESL